VMLFALATAVGEPRAFHPSEVSGRAWFALVYLIVMGSIVGFTCYVWLIHHESPTKVGTYAYVNPIVAVLIGYLLGDEPLGMRTILGTVLVLTSVLLITLGKSPRSRVKSVRQEPVGSEPCVE
jgi:drug/metabolite transporter (DMT)-like permease